MNNILYIEIPKICPTCNNPTEIRKENESKVLLCTNPNCKSKLSSRLSHFVSKPAMNIEGLSEATIDKFVELGWLSNLDDIYYLCEHRYDMMSLDGFGEKSVNKLLDAIEESSTNVKLENFLFSLGIPLVGKSKSKTISKYCNGSIDKFLELIHNDFDFSTLDDFGYAIHNSITNYFNNDVNIFLVDSLLDIMVFKLDDSNIPALNTLEGLTFVITGEVEYYKNRDALKSDIEANGGKTSGSVSGKTSYLINNDNTSTSGKNKKAKELGVPIITESEFLKMIK